MLCCEDVLQKCLLFTFYTYVPSNLYPSCKPDLLCALCYFMIFLAPTGALGMHTYVCVCVKFVYRVSQKNVHLFWRALSPSNMGQNSNAGGVSDSARPQLCNEH